jgi:Dolichyl-phosphate-mannose-protein mannosyltransferase
MVEMGAVKSAAQQRTETAPGASEASRRVRFATLAALLACCAAAVALHAVGIGWGLPFLYHPDEPTNFSVAQRMLKQLDPNPHFFHYPSLFFYGYASVEAGYFAVCRLFGVLHSLRDLPNLDTPIMGGGFTALPSAFLALRGFSAACGVATVVIAYRMGRSLSKGPFVGLLAALLVAVSPSILRCSRWIAPDAMVTLAESSALLASLYVWRFGRARDYILASVLAGLAASVKYNGALVGLTVAFAAISRDRLRAFKNPWFYAAPLIAIVSFALTTPYAFLDSRHFWADVLRERMHYATGHAGAEGNTFAYYCSYILSSEGIIIGFGLAGAVLGVVRRNTPVLILSAFCAIYFGFINSYVVRNGQTLVPIIPTLLVIGAWFLCEAFTWLDARLLRNKLPGSARVLLALVVVCLIAVHPLQGSVEETERLLWPDNRALLSAWVEQNIPPHARIVVEPYAGYVSRQRYVLKAVGDFVKLDVRWLRRREDYLIFSSNTFDRYTSNPTRYPTEAHLYQTFFSEFELLKAFDDKRGGGDIRVYRTRRSPQRGGIPRHSSSRKRGGTLRAVSPSPKRF